MKTFFKVLLIVLLAACVAGCIAFFVIDSKDPAPQGCEHDWQISETVPATCTLGGLTTDVRCNKCGEILLEQKELSPLGHDAETVEAKAATCTENGFTEGSKCSRCGEILSGCEPVRALGHVLVTTPEIPATCDAEGRTAIIECSECGLVVTGGEVIPHLEHSAVNVQYYTTDGYRVRYTKCVHCGTQMSEPVRKPIPESEYEELYITEGSIGAYEYASRQDIRYVRISRDVEYVGSCAFAMCPEFLVIEVDHGCDTSTWAEDWYMGNGDGETPFKVIYR